MRKLLFAASTLALLTAPVFAADPIADVASVYDWTGFYAGLNGGYGFGGDDKVGFRASNGFANNDVGDLDIAGIFGGAQAGWNFQTGNFVFGLEGDIQLANIDDDFRSSFPGIDFKASSDVDFFGTARLRAGWAFDRLLVYGTGGLAWADVDYSVAALDAGGNHVNITSNDVEFGYAVGGGAEFAINEAWSVKAEYQFIGLGSEDLTGKVRDAGGALNGVTANTVMTPSFHTVRVGVNWQF